ncbi:MAG TPA: choice-of-anchor Q domain-containing protein, partial [Anaerolineales bacterium]|nr:choice-of-anchor Q domain-containing protein [Anaerolineales bacterium]
SGSGELLLQFNVHDNIIQNNIFVANTQSWLMSNPYTENQNNLVDYNLYFAPAGETDSEWQWKNILYQGFDAYRPGTGNDAHSLFLPAQFADPAANDFHLLETSPARDAGDCTHAPTTDFDGDPRPQGSGCDIGADEFVVSLAFDQFIFVPLVEN